MTGKPAGDDLREGKRTLLIHATLHAATPAQRDELERGLGDRDLTPEGIDALRSIIVTSGGLTQVEERIENLRADALSALATASIDSETVEILSAIADAATRREA